MGLTPFDGQTFVAFTDLCGFKKMMTNEKKALAALDCLYNTTYELKSNSECYDNISSLAVSDCVISYITNNESKSKSITNLLEYIKKLHCELINNEYMLKTSIAYGGFSYRKRGELAGLAKQGIIGNAYITAFLNNDKVEPGSIIILKEGISKYPDVENVILNSLNENILKEHEMEWEYFWMLENTEKIDAFKKEKEYPEDAKYKHYISVIKKYLKPTNEV